MAETQARISLTADPTGVITGLARAQSEFQRFSSGIAGSVLKAQVAFEAVKAASQSAFELTFGSIEKVSAFKQLSEQIGDTAENLASLKLASDVSGVSMESIASASAKLTATLSKQDEEGGAAAKAIERLGLNFEEFRRLSPVAQIDAVAKAMAGFADGAGKTAVANALFGKSGYTLIPLFNDLANGAERQTGLTQKQIEAADEASKALARWRSQASLTQQQLVTELIPSISDLLQQFRDGKELAGGFWSATATFATINPFNTQAENLKNYRAELVTLQEARERYLRANSDTSSIDASIVDRTRKIAYLQRQVWTTELREFESRNASAASDPRRLDRKPALDGSGLGGKTGGAAADPLAKAKAYLDTLEKQALTVQKLSVYELALAEIQSGRLGKGKEIPKMLQDQIVAAAQRVDAYKKQQDEIEARAREADQFFADQLKKQEERDRERDRKLDQQESEARRVYDSVVTPAEKLAKDISNLQRLLDLGLISREVFERANFVAQDQFDATQKQIQKTRSIWQEFGLAATSAFEDAMVGGKGLSGVLRGLEQDIARIIIRKKITEPFGNALGDVLNGGDVGSGLSDFFSGLFGGARAAGGPVSAGKLYRVNEQGPELLNVGNRQYLMAGAQGGHITPNHMLGGGGAAPSISIQVDARGADSAAAEQRLKAVAAQIVEAAKVAVAAESKSSRAYRRNFAPA